jgi:hypothetical protein
MQIQREYPPIPKGTVRSVILDNVIACVVLKPNTDGKKSIVFFTVDSTELSEVICDFLIEDKEQKSLGAIPPRLDSARECHNFKPIIPGKRKYLSCNYCGNSSECKGFLKDHKKERRN